MTAQTSQTGLFPNLTDSGAYKVQISLVLADHVRPVDAFSRKLDPRSQRFRSGSWNLLTTR